MQRVERDEERGQRGRGRAEEALQHRVGEEERDDPRQQGDAARGKRAGTEQLVREVLSERQWNVRSELVERSQDLAQRALDQRQAVMLVAEEGCRCRPPQPQPRADHHRHGRQRRRDRARAFVEDLVVGLLGREVHDGAPPNGAGSMACASTHSFGAQSDESTLLEPSPFRDTGSRDPVRSPETIP